MAKRLKVCVYGAGAIGGSIAVRLARTNADLSVIARGAHGQAIRAHGLQLLSGDEHIVARLACADTPAGIADQDYVIVATKTTQLGAIASNLRAMLAPRGRVVFAMNGIPWWLGASIGLDFGDKVQETLDPGGHLRRLELDRVMAAVVFSPHEVINPGVIRHTAPGRNRLVLGKPDNSVDEELNSFAALLKTAGYESPIAADIRVEIWDKLLAIIGLSPACVLTGSDLDQMGRDPGCRKVMADVMREGLALGRKLGLNLNDHTDALIDQFSGKPVRPSLMADFEFGREPELDSGILALSTIAAAQGVATPMLDALAALTSMKWRASRR